MKKVKYHLRFQIIPGKNVVYDARILADLCVKYKIEEVVLFFAGEEWNNGLLSQKEEDAWFDTVSTVKKVLDDKGLSVSLNPWMTVLHCDRGRSFPAGRNFKPMVSPKGEKSSACASFADKNWQKYICNLYGRFAGLGFRVIWIEDDFRYHNHGPLAWGGGFEEEMCEKFSKKIGRNVSREEILEKILKPGRPHPWRSKWMEVWRETQLEAARGIAEAVKKNSPVKTKLGLMTSYLPVHSIEGRRWFDLFESVSIDGEVAHRPHFAGYSDGLERNRPFSIMALEMQKVLRPPICEVAPEIENFPFTAWSKSDTGTWADMVFAKLFGSDALLLDLFPFVGNRADEEPQIGSMLDKSYGSLSWVAKNFTGEHNLEGIGIPWKENSAELVRTEKGASMNELMADVLPAWIFLLSYGVPACNGKRDVNAVFGSSAWTFEDNEILEMLKGGLLLDGVSAKILFERGFGEYIGVEYKETLERENSKYSLEVITSEESGVREGLYSSVNLVKSLSVFEPKAGAVAWSDIITCENKRVGAGTTLYENSIGGRVAIFSVGDIQALPLSFHRQKVLHNIIRYLYRGAIPFPMVTGAPYLLPMYFKKKNEKTLVVFNGTPDPAIVYIKTTGKLIPFIETTILKPLERPSSNKLLKDVKNTSSWKTSSEIPYMSFLVAGFSYNKDKE